jgi:hypothetical protein
VSSLGHDGHAIAAPFPDVAIDEIVREVVHARSLPHVRSSVDPRST